MTDSSDLPASPGHAGTPRTAGTYADRSSAEARAFFQQRVANYLFMYGLLGGAFLALRIGGAAAVGGLIGLRMLVSLADFWTHAAAVGFGLIGWLVTRRGSPSMARIEAVESVCLIGSMVSYELMGYFFPPEAAATSDTVLLALVMGLFVRAIYVPSTARRSLLLGVAAAVPHVMTNYFALMRIPDELLQALVPGPEPVPLGGYAFFAVSFTVLWWISAITVTTAASHVIYGLRQRVRTIERLGQYKLERKIGEGGMGIVYRASHAMLQRPTAVKLLPVDKAGEASIQRFEREVRLTAKLTHPNTVTVFDYGRTPEGVFYYAMELLNGATLDRVVETAGALPAARVVHVLSQAASALVEAHDIGLIHRDIKPANIMLCEQGGVADTVKVLDFGLVKEVANPGASTVTRTDLIKGTPQYMPPEAITHPDDVDARGDVYALGAVGFFLLTGEDVFVGKSIVEICSHHLHTPPRRPSELARDIPSDVEEVVMKCLAKKREERPQSARELHALLEACACSRQWSSAEARSWWTAHPALVA